jgi:uncharacterized Zn finger protein
MWLWWWGRIESRTCPECAHDFVAAVTEPRKTYIGRCPICGKFWT